MPVEALLICGCGALLSALLTGVVRRIATRGGLVDVPNERSSHTVATPRGGGIAVVAVTIASLLAFGLVGMRDEALRRALIGGGLLVALVGYLDDRHTLPAYIRFPVHAAAAAWALWCLGGLQPLQVDDHLVNLGWGGHLLAMATIMWGLNLFNFMDGIDGLAASEAVFIGCAAIPAMTLCGVSADVSMAALALAAACFGFLQWNWPPAKIFMGDVGSGFVGFVIVVLALAAARESPAAPWVWLILGGFFFVDATVTLCRRIVRGERVHEAHRSHVYQQLARRWRSHRRVTELLWMVNVGWLLPLGLMAAHVPRLAIDLVLIALLPLVALALLLGAGRREN